MTSSPVELFAGVIDLLSTSIKTNKTIIHAKSYSIKSGLSCMITLLSIETVIDVKDDILRRDFAYY